MLNACGGSGGDELHAEKYEMYHHKTNEEYQTNHNHDQGVILDTDQTSNHSEALANDQTLVRNLGPELN